MAAKIRCLELLLFICIPQWIDAKTEFHKKSCYFLRGKIVQVEKDNVYWLEVFPGTKSQDRYRVLAPNIKIKSRLGDRVQFLAFAHPTKYGLADFYFQGSAMGLQRALATDEKSPPQVTPLKKIKEKDCWGLSLPKALKKKK